MKMIAIIGFSVLLLIYMVIQMLYLKNIKEEKARKLSWIQLIIISVGTYLVLVFPTYYLNQDTFSSNLNRTQNAIFITYMLIIFIIQIYESIQLKHKDLNLGILGYVPFISRAISILFFMGYLAIYTLP